MRYTLVMLVVSCLVSCVEKIAPAPIVNKSSEKSEWYHKDYEKDSIPGISLDRAYKELIDEQNGEEIIVAVIDDQLAIHHEDLSQQIYVNEDELPDNAKDDDNNGYIDDVHGWNFLGINQYESLEDALYDHTRVIKKFNSKFKDKKENELEKNDLKDFKKYQQALVLRNEALNHGDSRLAKIKAYREYYFRFIELFSDRFPAYDNFTAEALDTVRTNNEEEEKLLTYMKAFNSAGLNLKTMDRQEKEGLIEKYTSSNINYNERARLGDSPDDYNDTNYGSNNVTAPESITHGTMVAGLIAARRNNGKGIKGISNKIKLMILNIFPENGSLNDKDFYNAVRYAVDNGAKVINFSSGKSFTENEQLFFNALQYAENKDVLVITSAGNTYKNLDDPGKNDYPKDIGPDGTSVSNLIKVGASSENIGPNLYANFSNYGKNKVDFFAPGQNMITTTTTTSRYTDAIWGTSLASALTSGSAALLLSHYPKLSAQEIKKILMDSGNEYDIMAKPYGADSIPFKDLSKTGKILNVYNALKMAEKISSEKN